MSVNPNLSSQAYLFENFDFNRTPLTPPATKVVIHKKSKDRGSWDYHSIEGWYIGPSKEHYRCLKCYNPDTYSEVDLDTVQLIPNQTLIPVYTDVDVIKQAVADILHILKIQQKVTFLWCCEETQYKMPSNKWRTSWVTIVQQKHN